MGCGGNLANFRIENLSELVPVSFAKIKSGRGLRGTGLNYWINIDGHWEKLGFGYWVEYCSFKGTGIF